MKKPVRISLFYVFVACIAFGAMMFVYSNWNANSYYSKGWEDKVDTSNVKSRDEKYNKPSREPQAPGFREKDIKKYKGDRYTTW